MDRRTTTDDAPTPRAPRLRWRRTVPILLLLALAVHTLLPQLASLEAAAGVMQQLRWWAVALAVAAQVASYWGNAFTIQSSARLTGDRLSIGDSAKLALAASTVGLLAGGPLGYAAATYHWAHQRGLSRDAAVLCGWVPALFNMLMLVALGLLGALELLRRNLLPHGELVAVLVVGVTVGALLAAGAWLVAREERMIAAAKQLRRGWRRVRRRPRGADDDDERQAMRRLANARRHLGHGGWHRPLAGASANAGFDMLTIALLFTAAHSTLSPATLLAGYGLPLLLGRVSFLPGGIGIVEGGMVGAYHLVGVPTTTSVLVVLAYRGLSFWLPTLCGLPLAVLMQRGTR